MLNGRKKQSKRLRKKQSRKEKELNLERGKEKLTKLGRKAVEKKQATGFQSRLMSLGGINCSKEKYFIKFPKT